MRNAQAAAGQFKSVAQAPRRRKPPRQAAAQAAPAPSVRSTAVATLSTRPGLVPAAHRSDIQLSQVAALLGMKGADIEGARRKLSGFGDHLGRVLLARLAARPQAIGPKLVHGLSRSRADLRYRLMQLARCGLVFVGPQCTYAVDPGSLLAVRQYVELLITASAWSTGGLADDA